MGSLPQQDFSPTGHVLLVKRPLLLVDTFIYLANDIMRAPVNNNVP